MSLAVQGGANAREVIFGVYRDGDNNLDAVQERNVTDFIKSTTQNPHLKVVAEDTTRVRRAPFLHGELRSEWSVIEDGKQHITQITAPADMSDRSSLTAFVEKTLEARVKDARFQHADVWVDLVDHGGGDGGGLQADRSGGFMSLEDIAGSIADGRSAFHKKFPGADDSITGVLANQCLMATLGFADALSATGVKYLAASPETMIAPGVPSARFADVITKGGAGWAQDAVDVTMQTRYGENDESWHPAAAFDVLDLDRQKIAAVRTAVSTFNATVAQLPRSSSGREAIADIRADLRSVRGMVRFDHSGDMPWHADRPAIASYGAVADDQRLPQPVRTAASSAADAVEALVIAHKEYKQFGPFHASYADAYGPTAHLPINQKTYDAWADRGVSETSTAFYQAVHGPELARALGAYDPRVGTSSMVA